MKANLTPLSSLRTSSHHVPPFHNLPNCSSHPLLIYHSAFPAPVSPSTIESHLLATGVVSPQWRYTMYTTTHYHSTTHEVLVVSHGRARLCFGGEQNPARYEPVVSQGDVMIVPAGLAHRLLEDKDGGFEMVGAYPPGEQWDMCYGNQGEEAKRESVKSVRWFESDPVYGEAGPAVHL